jgi:RNA polymerase sigma-70 factor, ECF subfamily
MSPAVKSDADPFRTLYDANHQGVRRLLARMVGPQEAEDLAQAVFAKAATALPTFRGDARPSTWLYRIAANVASDWLRSRSAHEAKVTVQLPETLDHAASEGNTGSCTLDSQASPEQELIRNEMRDCIRDVIAQLPDRDRVVLVLGELGSLAGEEIAQTLGISRGNAKVRLHRARGQLKEALEARCDFYRNEDNELACDPKPAGGCASPSGCSSTAKIRRLVPNQAV